MLSFTCRTIDFIGNYVNFQYFFNCHTKNNVRLPVNSFLYDVIPSISPSGLLYWSGTLTNGFSRGCLMKSCLKKKYIYIYTYIIFYLDEPRIFMLFHSLYLTLIYKVYTRFTCGQNKLKNVQILILVHPL